ncbi:CRISPR-associated endoribonuclease Cas6 [Malaciobacter canalis]|uniref:CRISPR-associated endoribonuclease Cas6 n=1 Tax=Malaciobacter canalis TaxID=1912871 RepID=A0ABX4LQ02_9BACT|nr:CRISPR-associated endoribonuclease Cas6 [Malaciobacter canalis]PHO10020.1 CRISPR-associated endoribonuclease Cas6 [Malaciobacter canalis]QEE33683.1 CRISPR/Cas system-associated RAMP protein Cas6, type I-B [Malaciobacter canalis]
MKYFELKCLAYIKKEIELNSSFDIISSYINYCFTKDEQLKKLHEEKNFKNYCFGNFYPIEKDKLYKKGNTYEFIIRSLDEEFIYKLQRILRENVNNSFFQVLQTTKKVVKQIFISELYTITPTITTVKDENNKSIFWTVDKDGDILKLQKQLQDNLLKKYENFYNEKLKPTQNFIQLLEIKNQKPQSIYFMKKINDGKSIRVRLFGNKLKIVPNEDETSQKLAFVALSCGLGEKQSYGGGFVLSRV